MINENNTFKGFLESLGHILHDRNNSYGPPEKSLKNIADRWSVTLERVISPEQVAACLIDLKIARLQANDFKHQDSMLDIAGYAAVLSKITSRNNCG